MIVREHFKNKKNMSKKAKIITIVVGGLAILGFLYWLFFSGDKKD